jgi:hypothetical protein
MVSLMIFLVLFNDKTKAFTFSDVLVLVITFAEEVSSIGELISGVEDEVLLPHEAKEKINALSVIMSNNLFFFIHLTSVKKDFFILFLILL